MSQEKNEKLGFSKKSSGVVLKDVTKIFQQPDTGKDFVAVDHINLEIKDGEMVTLLGPSGCGKTTTLRMIAGLETPTSGRITIGDTVVFDSELGINIPANKRKVGFLFQNYALWPNMTVYQNISFGLSNIKEEMPKISFEAKNAARLAQILKNPQDVVKTLEECRDKNGKLDETKAIIKLIDTYTISQYTAQKLFGYHLEQGKDVSAEVKALEEKVEAARKAQPFNENFELLKELGKIDKPILLKRGLSATIEEWLMSAEYIMAGGNDKVMLCERGIRTYETFTRNTLDISAIPIIKKLSHLPVIVDPSHASGKSWLVEPLAMAAVAAGADGLIIEVHNDPPHALSDGAQSLTPKQFDGVAKKVFGLKKAVDKLN